MSNKKFDVITIGQLCQDILVTNIPENCMTSDKDTFLADDILMASGGDAVNEACMLAKYGEKCALLTRLDKKEVGEMIYSDLLRQGVDTSLLIRPDDCRTFTAIVVIKPNGDHIFLDGPGYNFTPRMSDIDMSVFEQTRAVSAGSLYALGELDTNGIADIFKKAQEHGAITIADMNNDSDNKGPHAVDHVFSYVDYLMPSYEEAVYVSGKTDPDEIADYFLSMGAKNVVLKMGGKGCFFKNKEERFYGDPYDVKPMDTTGCGDNFVAGFIHGILNGMSHEEAVDFASAAGALNSLGLGAHLYIESEQQVLDYQKTAAKRKLER